MSGFFFRPGDGFVGDVIPFYWQGQYHAFYLKASPPPRKRHEGTPYEHLVSGDLVHWDEWPQVIAPGPPDTPDSVSCFTGSVIERDGIFHLFYTGYPGEGKPQTVCRATSTDLHTWEKDPDNPILAADPHWYEPVDWRDPFPFWNAEAGEYWMLLAAREKAGPSNRRGCIALATSPDLETWDVQPPFWAPRLYYTHECPDLFRWQDKWVLVYSTFSERTVTHYRMSDTLSGPWLAPTDDTFDDRAFYAAKTASDGERRFVFGWLPTREGEQDEGAWQWGGDMVVHELKPATEGIAVVEPREIAAQFSRSVCLDFRPVSGSWQTQNDELVSEFDDGFSAGLLGAMPGVCRIECEINCVVETRACGLLLRAGDDLESYYQLRWEPGRHRIVFDRWPRPGDVPFMLERPLTMPAGESLQLKVILDGTAVVAYANDTIALSCRLYTDRTGQLGVFVGEGQATFTDIKLYTF